MINRFFFFFFIRFRVLADKIQISSLLNMFSDFYQEKTTVSVYFFPYPDIIEWRTSLLLFNILKADLILSNFPSDTEFFLTTIAGMVYASRIIQILCVSVILNVICWYEGAKLKGLAVFFVCPFMPWFDWAMQLIKAPSLFDEYRPEIFPNQ